MQEIYNIRSFECHSFHMNYSPLKILIQLLYFKEYEKKIRFQRHKIFKRYIAFKM